MDRYNWVRCCYFGLAEYRQKIRIKNGRAVYITAQNEIIETFDFFNDSVIKYIRKEWLND
jgi:hypothetical protein